VPLPLFTGTERPDREKWRKYIIFLSTLHSTFHDLYKVVKQWPDLTNIDDFIKELKENISTYTLGM